MSVPDAQCSHVFHQVTSIDTLSPIQLLLYSLVQGLELHTGRLLRWRLRKGYPAMTIDPLLYNWKLNSEDKWQI